MVKYYAATKNDVVEEYRIGWKDIQDSVRLKKKRLVPKKILFPFCVCVLQFSSFALS